MPPEILPLEAQTAMPYGPNVEELLSGTFHELKPDIHVITTDKVQELYDLLIKEAVSKKNFGLE